jgi:CheY-like chemotaxis protein
MDSAKGYPIMAKKTILVADDEAFMRDVFEEFYRQAGYVVRTAENGEEALAILEQETIDVMFLDLNMPRMSGLELCKKIRKNNPIACIYAVTGNAASAELTECREAGFDDYFTKPVDGKMLLKAAENAFEKINRWKKT